jgi:hypothetical protein
MSEKKEPKEYEPGPWNDDSDYKPEKTKHANDKPTYNVSNQRQGSGGGGIPQFGDFF